MSKYCAGDQGAFLLPLTKRYPDWDGRSRRHTRQDKHHIHQNGHGLPASICTIGYVTNNIHSMQGDQMTFRKKPKKSRKMPIYCIKWLKMPISGHPVVYHQSVDLTVKSYLIRQMLELAGQTV